MRLLLALLLMASLMSSNPNGFRCGTELQEMSVEFLGTDQRIDFDSLSASLDSLSSYSLSAWVYADEDIVWGTVLQRIDGVDTDQYFRIMIYGGANDNVYFYSSTFATSLGVWRTGTGTISPATWYHIALTYNASSTSNNPIIYINGVSKTVTETTTPVGVVQAITGGSIYIGNNAAKNVDYDGKLADVRTYNAILTAAQVLSLYNAGAFTASFDTNLVFNAPLTSATTLGGSSFDGFILTSSQLLIDRIGCVQGTPSGSPLGSDENP